MIYNSSAYSRKKDIRACRDQFGRIVYISFLKRWIWYVAPCVSNWLILNRPLYRLPCLACSTQLWPDLTRVHDLSQLANAASMRKHVWTWRWRRLALAVWVIRDGWWVGIKDPRLSSGRPTTLTGGLVTRRKGDMAMMRRRVRPNQDGNMLGRLHIRFHDYEKSKWTVSESRVKTQNQLTVQGGTYDFFFVMFSV